MHSVIEAAAILRLYEMCLRLDFTRGRVSEACIGNHSFYVSRWQEEVWFCILCSFSLTFYNLVFSLNQNTLLRLCLIRFWRGCQFLLFNASVIWLARIKRSITRVLMQSIWKPQSMFWCANCRTFSSNCVKKLLPNSRLLLSENYQMTSKGNTLGPPFSLQMSVIWEPES